MTSIENGTIKNENINENDFTKKKNLKSKIKDANAKNNSAWQFLKFLICSASAGIIQFVSFTILQTIFKKTGRDKSWGTMWFIRPGQLKTTFIATTAALCLSILWNFTLNRKFTFKAANNIGLAMVLAFCFYIPFYPFQTWYVCTVEEKLLEKTTDKSAIWPGLIAEGSVMILNFCLEFLWQKFVVFRNPKSSKEEKGKGKSLENEASDDNLVLNVYVEPNETK